MRFTATILFAAVCLVSLTDGSALARIWHVPSEAPTIQAGIDLAEPGDIVELACGQYFEHDIEMKQHITLQSESGDPDCATINGIGYTGIWLEDIEFTTIRDLTFINCGNGALRLISSHLLVDNCHFENNTFSDGGAIHMLGSEPIISNSTFVNNSASHAGGAIAMGGSTARVINCTFEGNISNFGGAIDCESDSELELENCTLVSNVANYHGGALFVWENLADSSILVFNSYIMDNQAPEGADGWANPGCLLILFNCQLGSDYNDTFDGPGTIVINGVIGVEKSTWGRLKALYK